ncbi:MAG: serine hydrolase, partial [Gammaproteobacteria bacterium]
TDRKELTATLAAAIEEPVTRNGMNLEKMRQGSFFTHTGKKKVQGTTSYATARQLMKLMLHMEQGKLVDEFSSREMKRLMYVTERRIRYASAPVLRDAAVYFKSGSLYKCQPEPDFTCKKYHGNVRNFMNSVAIVEYPSAERDLFYIVTLMSNVLRRNSAVDHQTFATRTHRLIQNFHKQRIETEKEAAARPPTPTISNDGGHEVYRYE